jgi:hypothetical protein
LELSWYNRRNFDLIGPITVEGVGGEIDKYGNIADMKSNGFELSLNTKNIKIKDFPMEHHIPLFASVQRGH